MRHLADLFRPVWWACLWRGHDPGAGLNPGERDHVGRPMACERCGREDAEMATWQYNRFCGVAARQEWDRRALASMAWDDYAAAMNGEPPESERLDRQLRQMLTPTAYEKFKDSLRRLEADPALSEVARRSF